MDNFSSVIAGVLKTLLDILGNHLCHVKCDYFAKGNSTIYFETRPSSNLLNILKLCEFVTLDTDNPASLPIWLSMLLPNGIGVKQIVGNAQLAYIPVYTRDEASTASLLSAIVESDPLVLEDFLMVSKSSIKNIAGFELDSWGGADGCVILIKMRNH